MQLSASSLRKLLSIQQFRHLFGNRNLEERMQTAARRQQLQGVSKRPRGIAQQIQQQQQNAIDEEASAYLKQKSEYAAISGVLESDDSAKWYVR